jgi:hypothetical protein
MWRASSLAAPVVEFPVVPDRAAYVIPVVGIVFIAMTAATGIGMFVAMTGRVSAETLMAVTVFVGIGAGGWWTRRTWRIHAERKLIVNAEGLTYVAFAGRSRLMRWSDIVRVDEEEEYGPDEGRSLIYRLARRQFIVRGGDFHGYSDLRQLTLRYLPSRTKLMPG